MSTEHRAVSAEDIDAAVRAVPGVSDLFPAGGVGEVVRELGATALGIGGDGAPRVRVSESPGGIEVELAVGVAESAGAVATCAEVEHAIRVLFEVRDVPLRELRVTVVLVDDSPPS